MSAQNMPRHSREVFLEDGAGFRNPSFAELCNFLRKRRVIHKRPNPGTVKFWQKMGREIAVRSVLILWDSTCIMGRPIALF